MFLQHSIGFGLSLQTRFVKLHIRNRNIFEPLPPKKTKTKQKRKKHFFWFWHKFKYENKLFQLKSKLQLWKTKHNIIIKSLTPIDNDVYDNDIFLFLKLHVPCYSIEYLFIQTNYLLKFVNVCLLTPTASVFFDFRDRTIQSE